MTKICLVFLFSLSFSSQLWAWGGKGHALICESAVHLVKSPELKSYLKSKTHILGHLCNIPDTHWRNISAEISKVGGPTHYIDPEILGLSLEKIPNDYQKIVQEFTGGKNAFKENAKIVSVPSEFGSNWWRVDQFVRKLAANPIHSLAIPKNSAEEQDENLPYNKAVFSLLIDMGLMGHFVGDCAQPLHNTADYDGYSHGHGGLHAYYEENVVAEFDESGLQKIVRKARSLGQPEFIKADSTINKMKALSRISLKDLDKVFKLDPILEKSVVQNEKGMEIKRSAKRKPAAEAFPKMEKLIVEQMARASLLLAHFWDQAYQSLNKPKLSTYKSYAYPFTPEFVEPDYFAKEKI